MIFKKAIPRRVFLRGLGATLALPLLDAMTPAFATSSERAVQAPVRLGVVYVPNGMWPMDRWTPKAEGPAFELTPTLEPLAPFRDRLLVLSGLANKEVRGIGHTGATTTFLTGVHPKETAGKDIHAGISMDQIAAQEAGKHTQLASLELSLTASKDIVGACDSGFSCTYVNTISWRSPTTALAMENDPRAVFERLFGDSDSTDRATRLTRMREQRSILDGLVQRASRVLKEIGPSDRAKITEYLEAIRDIERRIQIAEEQADRELPNFEKPLGAPASYEKYAKLMIDLQVLAYQCDLTRVVTFMMGREGSTASQSFPEIGITDLHHTLSHHQNNPATIEKLFQVNLYHMKLFAYLLEKLRSTPDGDGNLLDHSILLYGSGLRNGNVHDYSDLPVLLIGGGGGQIKGGRHIKYPENTPMANLHLTILDKLGVRADMLGDSTGKLKLLSV